MSRWTKWSDERSERLRDLWVKGFSASQIARDLGGVSRNAVIGKITRLGIASLAPTWKPSYAKTPLVQRIVTPREKRKAMVMESMKPIEPAALPDGTHYTMATIPFSGRCKYPFGEIGAPDFHLCGLPAEGSYCAGHRRLCFNTEAMWHAKRAARHV